MDVLEHINKMILLFGNKERDYDHRAKELDKLVKVSMANFMEFKKNGKRPEADRAFRRAKTNMKTKKDYLQIANSMMEKCAMLERLKVSLDSAGTNIAFFNALQSSNRRMKSLDEMVNTTKIEAILDDLAIQMEGLDDDTAFQLDVLEDQELEDELKHMVETKTFVEKGYDEVPLEDHDNTERVAILA